MKKLNRILPGLLLLAFSSFAQGPKNKTYEISGVLKGLNSSRVYLLVHPSDNSRKFDTLETVGIGDKFRFAGPIAQQRRVDLYVGDLRSRNSAYFYLEPGKIKVTGHKDSLNYLSVTGTLTNNERTEVQRFLAPLYEQRSSLAQKMRVAKENDPEARQWTAAIRSKTDSINAYKMRFMEKHPNSAISYGYLYVLQDGLPVATAEKLYNSFSADWKKTQEGRNIYTKIQASKSVSVGKIAPDFTSTDTSGVKIKLSDFKGKYVLLEFWANWCIPCRAQNPHLKEMYEQYKDKGFTILQYSVDVKRDAQKWKDAIKQDGLIWPQVCDLQPAGAPVATLYGVQPIPDNFLISPDGKVLGRRLNKKELEVALMKLL